MSKKNLMMVAVDGQLDRLLSVEDATVLAKKLKTNVLCNQGWPEEVTGKEKRFTITKENLDQVVSAVICRAFSFPTRVPLTYKVECGF